MTTMTAAVFARRGVLEIEQRPLPHPNHPDEALLEVEATGVCGTDLHILSDPPGHPASEGAILGHEIVARVIAVGPDGDDALVGTRVVVDPNLKCGLCRPCRRGLQNHCERWTTIGVFRDGGFARQLVAPVRALHPLPESVPLADAVWTELLSCVIGSTDRIAVQPGRLAVVVGAGPAGMLHGLMLRAAGARVLISDVAPLRLDLAQRSGLEAIDVREASLADAVAEASDGWGADVVVDAVGTQLPSALELVATGGTVSLFGMNSHADQRLSQYGITRKELTVFGSFVGYHVFPRAIAVLAAGAIRPGGLTTHEVDIAGLPGAIEAARRGEAMKVMVRP
jgi:threonine dehydrogenase-like Zn-dependent dehydrogenase